MMRFWPENYLMLVCLKHTDISAIRNISKLGRDKGNESCLPMRSSNVCKWIISVCPCPSSVGTLLVRWDGAGPSS